MHNAIDIRNLGKTYAGDKKSPPKTALQDVILGVPQGSMFALLGPNGAGKSTIINIMAGLVHKSAGTVRIWDTDMDDDPRQARANIGIVPQEVNFDPFFTPRQLLEIQAGLYGVPRAERRTDELLERVGLQDMAHAYTRSLSGGMRRRLMVAKAMVHAPPILVLDEPTAGVDVELRRQLWRNVRKLNEQGTTILLTTHYLEEAEELCDKIAIINHGRVIACDDKENLLARLENKEITFRLDTAITTTPPALARMGAELEGRRSIKLSYSPEQTRIEDMIAAIHEAGHTISDIATDESDLEDLFLQLTQERVAETVA